MKFERDNCGLGPYSPEGEVFDGVKNVTQGHAKPHWSFKRGGSEEILEGTHAALPDESEHLIPPDATEVKFIPEGTVLWDDQSSKAVHDHGGTNFSGGVPYRSYSPTRK